MHRQTHTTPPHDRHTSHLHSLIPSINACLIVFVVFLPNRICPLFLLLFSSLFSLFRRDSLALTLACPLTQTKRSNTQKEGDETTGTEGERKEKGAHESRGWRWEQL